jgi:hypothetical protein
MTLVILYPFSVWCVCKHDFWAHILCAFGSALKPGVTPSLPHRWHGKPVGVNCCGGVIPRF